MPAEARQAAAVFPAVVATGAVVHPLELCLRKLALVSATRKSGRASARGDRLLDKIRSIPKAARHS